MRRRPSLAKGLLTGLAAGIAATLVMDQFQKLLTTGQQNIEKQQKLAAGESLWEVAQEQTQQQQEQEASEGSTEKVARKIAESTGTSLTKDQRKPAGQAVHYTFGTLMGLVYAITAEWLPEVTTGGGTAFGTMLFLAADEVAVPAFQLAPPPSETPLNDHMQHWAAHAVYGATLELSRNLVRRLL